MAASARKLDQMRTLHFLLVVCALSFAGLLKAEQDGSGDPDDSERLQYTEEDLPKDEKDPAGASEIDEFARRRGFNYARVTRRAARGDAKALKQFFAMAEEVDGAAAESYSGNADGGLSPSRRREVRASSSTPSRWRFGMMVRNYDRGRWPAYLRRHFPETTQSSLSPRDGRLAFAGQTLCHPQNLLRRIRCSRGSKVERAELIDQKSGQVLCDLTPDDIGTGADREGEVLWSPDSKRFAYRSSDLTQ